MLFTIGLIEVGQTFVFGGTEHTITKIEGQVVTTNSKQRWRLESIRKIYDNPKKYAGDNK